MRVHQIPVLIRGRMRKSVRPIAAVHSFVGLLLYMLVVLAIVKIMCVLLKVAGVTGLIEMSSVQHTSEATSECADGVFTIFGLSLPKSRFMADPLRTTRRWWWAGVGAVYGDDEGGRRSGPRRLPFGRLCVTARRHFPGSAQPSTPGLLA